MTDKKTFILSIDSGCWEYLDPLLEQGRMPNLSRLIERGTRGVLESTMPPVTPVAFSSFITGLNPGKHGIFDWSVQVDKEGRFQSANAVLRRGVPFWTYLNRWGVRVGLINIPVTYPPEPLDGFMIVGISVPESSRNLTHPASILDEVEAKYGPYYVDVPMSILRDEGIEAYTSAWCVHEDRQTEVALDLIDRYDVQVLALNYVGLDRLNHFSPDFVCIERVLENVDRNIGRFMKHFPNANFMIMSDHGSRRLKGAFLLGKWLVQHGFLSHGEKSLRIPRYEINFALSRLLGEHYGLNGLGEKMLRRLLGMLFWITPLTLAEPAWRFLARRASEAFAYRLTDRIDFPVTKAYVRSNSGPIIVNMGRRGQPGPITSADYEQVRQALIDELSRVSDPFSGKPVFRKIYGREEIYHGDAMELAPDLIADHYDSTCDLIVDNDSEYYFFVNRLNRFGDHKRDGLFVFAGPDFARLRSDGHRTSIMDIPVTLLHLYGVPIPEDMDGRVAVDFLAADFMRQHPVKVQSSDKDSYRPQHDYTEDEIDQLSQHLKDLGYL
jgi:predicted AlkP superfamily phosphohydrolase/phosphomutase